MTCTCPKCGGTMYHVNFDYYRCSKCGYSE